MKCLQRNEYILGGNQTKKNWQNGGACFSIDSLKKLTHCIFEMVLGVVG